MTYDEAKKLYQQLFMVQESVHEQWLKHRFCGNRRQVKYLYEMKSHTGNAVYEAGQLMMELEADTVEKGT
mgnify:CR=1 FL=1